MRRLGVIVHPSREIEEPLAAAKAWTERHDVELIQVPIEGRDRDVAKHGDPASCELLLAIGGDGTTLAAIRVGAAVERPVLGVACGSLGALTTVAAGDIAQALQRFVQGDWRRFEMPALHVEHEGGSLTAFNDIAMIRCGEGQLRTTARVDGALYARFAGDGCIVSTALGSSAYALAARGPLLAPGADAFLLTPVSPHGGHCPPLVIGAHSELTLELTPGHSGARLELDGQVTQTWSDRLTVTPRENAATIVRLPDQIPFLEGLRKRRIIIDSPRIVADDEQKP